MSALFFTVCLMANVSLSFDLTCEGPPFMQHSHNKYQKKILKAPKSVFQCSEICQPTTKPSSGLKENLQMAYQRPSSSAYLNVSRSDDDEFWVYSKPKTWNRDLTSYPNLLKTKIYSNLLKIVPKPNTSLSFSLRNGFVLSTP